MFVSGGPSSLYSSRLVIINNALIRRQQQHQQRRRWSRFLLPSTSSSSSTSRNKFIGITRIGAIRNFNVHEYITMELFRDNQINTPRCYVANSPEEAENIYLHKLNNNKKTSSTSTSTSSTTSSSSDQLKDVVMKAQVLSGGRGLGTFKFSDGDGNVDGNVDSDGDVDDVDDDGGDRKKSKQLLQGGVHMITKPGQAREYAKQMIGNKLITTQAPNGIICNKVLLMERIYMKREIYLCIMMDRTSQGPLMICSPHTGSGKSIEDIAKYNPELIFTEPIDIMEGLSDSQCHRMAKNMALQKGTDTYDKAIILMKNLYEMFIGYDCLSIEINPLAVTTKQPDGDGGDGDDDIVVCDAKIDFDPKAEYRQNSIFDKRDYTQEDPIEVDAAKYDLKYIALDENGNIGCMVNGGGMAMASADIIQHFGGKPANLLHVKTKQQVQKGFEILNDDDNIKAIFINIFGGIIRCDVIAGGIINAAKATNTHKPIIVRLQGTNVEQANTMIEGCGYKIILATDLEDAAHKVVEAADIVTQAENIEVTNNYDGFQL